MWRAPSARLLRDGRCRLGVVLARAIIRRERGATTRTHLVTNEEALHEGQAGHCAAGAGSTGLLKQRAGSASGAAGSAG